MAQGAGEQQGRATHHEEEMPRVVITRRQAIAFAVFVLTVVGFLYFVLPKLAGVGTTLHHLEHGDGWWIAFGVVLELLSFAGYVVVFRAVFVTTRTGPSGVPDRTGPPPAPGPIGWSESYQITMAGLAATRLFATAGAGGVALTAWALRRSGMEARLVACRMVAFMVLLYAVYAVSVLIDGLGLGTGLFPGGGSFALTIVPAIVSAILMTVVGAMALLPGDIERRLGRWASGSGRLAHWVTVSSVTCLFLPTWPRCCCLTASVMARRGTGDGSPEARFRRWVHQFNGLRPPSRNFSRTTRASFGGLDTTLWRILDRVVSDRDTAVGVPSRSQRSDISLRRPIVGSRPVGLWEDGIARGPLRA